MKKFISIVLSLAMLLAFLPVVSLAADSSTVTAVRTAYFNSTGGEWALYDTSTNSDNVLVSTGADGWTADSSFTDEDGTVTSQSSLSGTNFGSARNALVAFTIPEDLDMDNVARVTLSMTVKNVKQVTSGVRLAVYGNSIEGTWSASTSRSVFTGSSTASVSGLSNLTCLGLTDAIETGNQTGETASGETITLTSIALTNYVKEMAAAGYEEVTFRLAAPLGGIRIYSYNTSYAPTLTFTEGTLSSVNVKTVYYDGDTEVDSVESTVGNLIAGDSYTYSSSSIESYVTVGSDIYCYDEEKSSLTVTVAEDGSSEIVIAYTKYDAADSFSGYELTDEGAWCWFADPRSISYKNDDGTLDFTIIGYIDVHGNIKATQIDNLTNTTEEVLIRSNIQPDDHNNPTFLVLPDERIIVFYSRHTDEACFWYRVTTEKGDLTTLGEEKCLNTDANTTYPSPFLMEDDPDSIYLCWRGINWHPTIAKLSLPDENGDLEFTYGPYQMVQSTGARPYAKYASNGKDKIYVTYTTGHPDNEQPNWVYFNQINIADMTLEDINGNTLSTIANGALAVNKTDYDQTFIVDTAESSYRDWVWQTAIGNDGYPVIAMVRISGGKTSHDYYYVKWNGSEWVKTYLINGGGAFHQSSGLEMCYSGGMAIDPDNTNVIYVSAPVTGVFGDVYEIIKFTMSDDGTSIVSQEQITKNSQYNNVRPFIIPNSEDNDLRLIWMYGEYYDWIVSSSYTTQGFCTAVHTEVPVPESDVDLTGAIAEETYDEIGGVFVSTEATANIVEASASGEFTVSADVYMDGTGSVLDMGGISFAVTEMETQYGASATGTRKRAVTTVNGEDYVSSNVYGTSDIWTTYSRGTGGEYGISDYDGYVNLTFVYDGEKVKVYRDGLLDQNIAATDVELSDVKVGGFEGYAENVVVYDRALNSDEVKVLAAVDYEVSEIEAEGDVTITINYTTTLGKAIIASETVTLPYGTDEYMFATDTLFTANGMYVLDEELSDLDCDMTAENPTIDAVYVEYLKGNNLFEYGTFEDEDGSFTPGNWQSARGDGYFKDISTDYFYVVDLDTDSAEIYVKGSTHSGADDYALGTRWNDSETGLCSMVNFIEVEAGKTYYVSYDFKHKTAGTDGGYIRTTFQPTNTITTDDGSDNNTPQNVTTEWQSNRFAITAPSDGYIYFHFSYLGVSGNAGAGPYWYFDNFEVCELVENDACLIEAALESSADGKSVISLTNNSGTELTGVKVYAASAADAVVNTVNAATLDFAVDEVKEIEVEMTGEIKIYVWNDAMQPLTEVQTVTAE